MIPRGYMPPAAPALDLHKDDDRHDEDRDRDNVRVDTVMIAMPSDDSGSASDEGESSLVTATLAYHEMLESVREELEEPSNESTIGDRATEIFAAVAAFLGRREAIAAITILVLSLLGVSAAVNRRAVKEIGDTASPPNNTAVASIASIAAAQPIPVPVSTVSVSNTESTAAKISKPRLAEEHGAAAKKIPEKKVEQPARLNIPSLSSAVLSGLDSAAAKAATVGNRAGDAFNVQPSIGAVSQKRATFDDEQSSAPQRARLIGELPTPVVPPQVADVEGEVRVRFNVDTLGRPMIGTFSVVSSPNPLLTAAVRKVIPGMRFEPARTGGSEAKAIGDVVQIGFQFARSR